MPTSSPMKRPSVSGRLGRLLASLRPPRRAGPLIPVQTGFPTSLADLVVKNHVRLRNPTPTRRRHRTSVAPPAAVVAEPPPQSSCGVLTGRNAVVKGAAFSILPDQLVLAVGGAVALALLVIWCKWLVAAATVASVALFWIDSASRRRENAEGLQVCVSPIREAEAEAETPTRSSCADSDEKGSEVWAADTADDQDSILPKSKVKRRSSLRKLIPKKLRNGKRSSTLVVDFNKDTTTGSLQHPDDAAGEAVVNSTRPVLETSGHRYSPAPVVLDDTTTPPDAIAVEKGCSSRKAASAFPSPAAFVPVILVGLVAGKIPAVALTVLCAVVFLIEHSRQSAS